MPFLSLSNISILSSIRINLVNNLASPVNDNNASEGAETEHPEPEKDVDLLVHHIQGEDAHSWNKIDFDIKTLTTKGLMWIKK